MDEVAENFFLPCPMGDVGKRLLPTFASGGTGFEFVSFPLVQAFNWDGMNLLKRGDRKQLETEPKQSSGNQYALSPLQLRKEISVLRHSCQIGPLKENQDIFSMVTKHFYKLPFKHLLWLPLEVFWRLGKNNFLYHTRSSSLPHEHSQMFTTHSWQSVHWKKLPMSPTFHSMLRKWQSLLDADVALYPLRDVLFQK